MGRVTRSCSQTSKLGPPEPTLKVVGATCVAWGMRTLYDADHEAFRESFASFVAKEVSPHYLEWEDAGIAPREMYASAGQYGFVGMAIPEEYGGGGTDDFRFNAMLTEEFNAAGIGGAGLGLTLHNDICTPYFIEYCNAEQADRWLPGIASGELITAIAMTEPGTGSDLAGIAHHGGP